eukprot:gene5171-4742_t
MATDGADAAAGIVGHVILKPNIRMSISSVGKIASKDGTQLMGSYTLYIGQLIATLASEQKREDPNYLAIGCQVLVFLALILARNYKNKKIATADKELKYHMPHYKTAATGGDYTIHFGDGQAPTGTVTIPNAEYKILKAKEKILDGLEACHDKLTDDDIAAGNATWKAATGTDADFY